MKLFSGNWMVVLLLCCGGAGAEVKIGQSTNEVKDALGPPLGTGSVKGGGYEWWVFNEGFVRIESGKVADSALLSPEKLAEKQEQQKIRAEQLRVLRERGEARKQEIMNAEGYRSKSPAELVRLWDEFKREFPNVPIDLATYTTAYRHLSAQRLKARNTPKIEEVEEPARISGKRIRKLKRAGKWDAEKRRPKAPEEDPAAAP